jgi:hypothetical protein
VRKHSPWFLFRQIEDRNLDKKELPLWVPDWTISIPYTKLRLGDNKVYQASMLKVDVRHSEDFQTLFMRGKIVDVVQYLETFVPPSKLDLSNDYASAFCLKSFDFDNFSTPSIESF